MSDLQYAPRWFYHKDGRSQICESAAHEARLMTEGGWADSPAAHGVITAPDAAQRAQMPKVFTPPVSSGSQAHAAPSAVDLTAFSALLHQWQHTLDQAEASRREVVTQLVAAQDRIAVLEGAFVELHERLHAVEQYIVKHPEPAAAASLSARPEPQTAPTPEPQRAPQGQQPADRRK
jgi:hypothetical protein